MSRERYFAELELTKQDFVHLGHLAEAGLADALQGLTQDDAQACGRARAAEQEIDALNKKINESCLRLMTLQAPVAGDARLVTGLLGAVVDLELVGDYCDDIAALALAMTKRPTGGVVAEFSALGVKVREMLSQAVAAWTDVEAAAHLSLRPAQATVKRASGELLSKVSQLRSTPQDNSVNVGLILICKYLERVASHSVSLAEQAAFVAGVV